MKNLLIVGCGGHGKCCLEIARATGLYEHIAFLDDQHLNEDICGCKVIGTIDEMSSYVEEYQNICIAIGNNAIRKKLYQKAVELKFHIPNLIHPSAVLMNAQIGNGCVVFPNVTVEADAKIGDGCILSSNCVIHHDANIEGFVLIYSNSTISPNTCIGAEALIERNCCVEFGTQISAGAAIAAGTIVSCQDEYSFEVGV